MAITKLQGPFSGSGTTSVVATFGGTPTPGSLLIAAGYSTGNISGASISGWTPVKDVLYAGTSSIGLWYKIAGASESTTVTLTWTGGTGTILAVAEYSDVNTPDQSASIASTGAGVTSRSTGTTPTTTADDELLVAIVGMGNTVSAESWSNSFTTLYRNSATPAFVVGTRIVSAAAAYETTLSWTTSRFAGGLIATFKMTSAEANTRMGLRVF